MGIEPTIRLTRITGFEDQEGHQTPIASPPARIARPITGRKTVRLGNARHAVSGAA